MNNKKAVALGLTVALALIVAWGLFRDPLLLVAALAIGVLVGLALWLFS